MTIKQEQRFLKEQSFYTGNIDGKYGPATKQATKEFQKSQHLEIDGKFGPRTTKVALAIAKMAKFSEVNDFNTLTEVSND